MLDQATTGAALHLTYLDDAEEERQISGTLLRATQTDDGISYEIRIGQPTGHALEALYKA